MSEQSKMELDRHFAWFEERLPPGPARFVRWLRQPSSRYVRIPLAVLLIVGGIFVPAGAWTVDAPARTPFVRAGCADPAKAADTDTRLDRAQVD